MKNDRKMVKRCVKKEINCIAGPGSTLPIVLAIQEAKEREDQLSPVQDILSTIKRQTPSQKEIF